MSQYLAQSSNRTRRWIFAGPALLLLTVGAFQLQPSTPAVAALPSNAAAQVTTRDQPAYNDGLEQLPVGQRGLSYSTLTHMGRVHPQKQSANPTGTWKNPFAPLITIVFGPERNTSGSGAGEPAAGMNPINPLLALVSGNTSLDHTIDGGNTWQSIQPPNAHGFGDVVNGWLNPSINSGNNALEVALNPSGDGADLTCARSSDAGVTFVTDSGCGASLSTTFFDDREYLWTDYTPSSPFFGRVYLTEALFDSGGSGSFNTVTLRRSNDNGVSWQPPSAQPLGLVPGNEFATGANHNEYPSLGISANGTLGYAWHRGLCCGGSPTVGTNNKVMFARSTDGGVTFPFSDTIVTVPLNQAVPFNSTSPLGVRWSDTPNITADPLTNGTFYALWTQYRTPSTAASAAIYLARSVDNGATWSAPVIVYNNPNANIFQGFGWVKVTPDHTVHVTFLGGTTSNTVVAQFYVNSTDGGATFSAPFQLSSTTFGPFGTTTDYEANDVGGYSGGNGSVLTSWAENAHFARIGILGLGTPTPTPTGTRPTATTTPTFTQTPTPTATACGTNANYTTSTTTGTIVPGVTDTGNHCDDCTTPLTLPFPLTLYGVQYTTGSVSSNGNLQFGGTSTSLGAACLPNPVFTSPTIFLYQDDLRTDGAGDGIFTLVTGTAPNRTYIIEWRTTYFGRAGNSNEELVFAENNPNQVSMVYGANADNGTGETSGVQQSPTGLFTQYSCTTATLTAGLRVDYRQIPCGGTTTVTTTGTPATATRTSTALATVTATPTACGAAAGWTAGANFPLTGITRPVGAYYPANGRFYTLGGRTSDTAGSDLPNPYEYNPANNTWTTKAATFADNQVNNMAGGVLTVAGTDTIVVVGGSAAGATSATAAVRYYNPVTDVLTVVTSDPWPGDANGTTLPGGYAVANNKLYILGSFNINVAMTTDIWQYDPSAAAGSRWLQRVNLPLARGYIPATSIGNVIYTGGGSDYVGGTVTDNPDSFRFDPVANTITTIAPIPRATGETRAVTLNGKMWVLGGGRVAPNPNNEVDIYDPGTNAWTLGLPFVNARRNDGAGTDGSRIFLVGGYAPTVPTNSLEIYTSAVPCGTATVTATSVANTATVTRTSVANTATVTSVAATTTATSVGATTTATSVGATTTATSVPANTSTATSVPANTSTVTRVPSATPCTIRFSDVTDPTTYYYQGVYYLACHGVISGYSDGTYRPFNNTTRGQMTKIVTLAFNIPLVTPPATGTFTDVLPDNVFYQLIETAAARGIVSGYTCGGINSQTGTPEPCDGARRPYFRPSNFVTRGQLTKIVVLGAGFPLLNPPTPTFTDVVPSNVFYQSIETAVCHGAITGYDDHTFRPNNYAFRGQIAKIVYLAVTNPAGTCPAAMPITH